MATISITSLGLGNADLTAIGKLSGTGLSQIEVADAVVEGDKLKKGNKIVAYDGHLASTSNPHSTTANQVGAYSKIEVDNLLANTETLLSNKVDKVTGKGLSTNDFTNTFKQALELKKVQDISTDSVTKKLVVNYTDATVANLNINDIITDVQVSGATLDATTNVLTLTSTDGGADVTVDLSDFVNSGEFTSALSEKADYIHSHLTSDIIDLDDTLSNLATDLSNKQDNLVSGTSIKTINGQSVLGSGDIEITGGGSGGGDGSVINKPVIISPANLTVDYTGAITSTYSTSSFYEGVQTRVIWECALAANFNDIIDSYEGSGNLTSWTPDVGELETTQLFVRTKQISDGHRSVFSDVISFTTPDIYVATPTLTVSGQPSDIGKNPTLTTSAFTIYNGTDEQLSTDYQILKNSDGSLVWESLGNTADKLTINSGDLEESTEYRFRARHNSTNYGSSAWVEVIGTTKDVFSTPYGLKWNQETDVYEALGATNRTLIQLNMKRCVLKDDGTVNYYLNPTNSTQKEQGGTAVLTGADGNVMVEVPKFWYKHTLVGDTHEWWVSTTPLEGYSVHPWFLEGGVERPFRYYRAYTPTVVAGKLRSISGSTPTKSQTRSTFRTQARANGTGWELCSWNAVNTIQLLFLTEHCTFNTQAVLGTGNDISQSYGITTGQSNSIGNASSGATNNNTWMSYRGIENWYADCWEFIDGINVQNYKVFLNQNPTTFADSVYTGDYVDSGVTVPSMSNTYIKKISGNFLPTAVGGSSTTFVTDGGWSSAGDTLVFFGGAAYWGLSSGGFTLDASYGAGAAIVSISAGLSR